MLCQPSATGGLYRAAPSYVRPKIQRPATGQLVPVERYPAGVGDAYIDIRVVAKDPERSFKLMP
jgi:hypothetical protein